MTGLTEGEACDDRDGLDRDRADRAATDWLIRLQDRPDDDQLRAGFKIWLDAAPVNASAWRETERVARVIAAVPARPRAMGEGGAWTGRSRSSAPARLRRTERRSRPRRIFAMSAMAAIACLALVAAPDLLLRLRADAVAATGAMKTVRLADGSLVRLAPNGALAIDFADDQRRVSLLRGSAYFEVAHDAARPFRIAAGDTTTTVLGTAFEVRQEGAGVAVAVRRGLVRVSCNREPGSELLSAGQSIDLRCGRPAQRTSLAPSRVAPWTEGQLVANDRSMREVIDALRPWQSGIIWARGEGLDRRRVTGVYNLRNPDSALAAAHDARVRRITPWITLISID